MAGLILKPGREESLLRRHPWIFSGAVSEVVDTPEAGATVDVYSSHGDFLARAAYSPCSNIRARIWSWNQDEKIDASFFYHTIKQSMLLRETNKILFPETNAIRLVHGESDGLPGLVVDRYNDVIVVQLLTAGVEYWRDEIVEVLKEIPGTAAIYERSEADVRELEGLGPQKGLLWGCELEEHIIIVENGLSFLVDVRRGHKTGFYLDQRLNRLITRKLVSRRDVLDCFSYTGGFSLNSLLGGASSVVAVDSSSDALGTLLANLEYNQLTRDHLGILEGDVFQVLRQFRDQDKSFDLIILDPPKFAHTASMAERAARGYKDINLLAFKLLRSGGVLVTFSCSGGVSNDLFQKIVAGAALDAGVDARILTYLHQDADHPVALNFPEGAYLKGLVVSVMR
ncbi:MAG: 23S rRNA methyltransferase [Chloroflexi bacterium RBG_19FT_COMBO_47_9]|nr:MAG: 23S rRNA methyltransferase [Chloroflexi bacterium RBG_19FT_COMBO_47_9]